MTDHFIQARRMLLELMNTSRLHEACLFYLREGGEVSEAEAMLDCTIEYGEVKCQRGSVYEIDITLRCKRELVDKLRPRKGADGWEADPPLKARLVDAIKMSLPSGYSVGSVEARARMTFPKSVDGASGKPATKPLSVEHFSNPEWLAKLGRKFVNDLVVPFKNELEAAGLGFPDINLKDADYFQEVGRVLKSEQLPRGLRARIEEIIEGTLRLLADHSEEAKAEFNQRHHLLKLHKKESGRALLSVIDGCHGIHPDYPERLTDQQAEIIAWTLDFIRDYADCYDDVEPGDLMRFEQQLSAKLEALRQSGLAVFAGKYARRIKYKSGTSSTSPITVVFVAAVDDPKIKRDAAGHLYIDGAIPKSAKPEPETEPPNKDSKGSEPIAASQEQTGGLVAEVRKAVKEELKQSTIVERSLSESEVQRILGVLTKLRTETGVRKAPLHTVFDYMVFQGLSGEETARKCKCAPSLISARAKTLKERLGMSVEQLRNLSSQLLERDRTVKGDPRRKKSGGMPDGFAVSEGDDGDLPSGEDEGNDV